MERLTAPAKNLDDGRTVMPIIDGRAVREHAMDFYWRLKEYEDLEEQGLLLKLPCKVGDTLYDIYEFIDGCTSPEIHVIDASRIEISKDEEGLLYTIDGCDFREKTFGTEVFAKETEAEKALEEMEKDE